MTFKEGLALLFIYLKLTHQIEWSWWWVLAPTIVIALFGVYRGNHKGIL